jgi:hypothetical protein
MLIVAIVFVLSTLGIYMMRGSGGGNGGESPRDKAVASIDGEKVMKSDIEMGVRNMAQQNSYTELNAENIVKMRKSVLDNMAVYEELKKETASRGIKVEKSEIDEAVKRIEEQFPTKEAFQQYMDNNRIRMEDLREEIELRLAQQKLLEQVTQDVVVSEEEAKEFYDQTSEFFFTQPAGFEVTYALFDSAEVAESAKERILNGEHWDEVMESFEEGVLDWVALEDPVFLSEQELKAGELKQFADLEMNEIGGPAEFGEGNVLIFAKRKKIDARTFPYEEISGDVVKILKSEKIQQNEQEFFKKLRERADVKILDEEYFTVPENTLSGDEDAASSDETAGKAVGDEDLEEGSTAD